MLDFEHDQNAADSPEATESVGTIGGGSAGTPGTLTPEDRMDARALRERWPITPSQRRQIADRLIEIVNDPSSSPREVVTAARALITADKVNIDSDAVDKMPDQSEADSLERFNSLSAIIERLNSFKESTVN